ncbi:MAG: hypothetical protein IPN43_13790 [Chitinophagaceae bacterium]|nr:hypothetical protein [Chitinophagaceae bacterium]
MSDTEGSIDKTIISMTALSIVDFYIDKEGGSHHLHLEHDHPLLWRFNDIQCDLYISGGQPKQIEKIVFDLLQIHNSLFDQYLPFDLQLLNVLNAGHGLLKKGSKKLLTEFAESLNKNGIKTSIISEIIPNDKTQHLAVLFLGHSYVIAEQFNFEITK